MNWLYKLSLCSAAIALACICAALWGSVSTGLASFFFTALAVWLDKKGGEKDFRDFRSR